MLNISTILLIASIATLGYLLIYALIYLIFSLIFITSGRADKSDIEEYHDSVSIIIPAFNEDKALIDTIQTLINQIYPGLIEIFILVENSSDSSIQHLKQFFKNYTTFSDGSLEIFNSDNRNVKIIYTKIKAKREKLNLFLPNIKSKYTGFLDADHRAENRWVASSVSILKKTHGKVVQSRRQPLSSKRFFQLWDSLQNHVGNEVFNFVLKRMGRTSFFTGTTCIFETELIQKYNFPNSITEDTHLTYEILTDGQKIQYNSEAGSYEEVAPDPLSYIARRRRWSTGHTQTFFHHLKKIFNAKLTMVDKIQLLLHGQFYLIPLAIIALLNLYGIYFFLQLTTNIQLLVIVLSIFFSFVLTIYATTETVKNYLINMLVALIWIFPQFSTISIWIYKLLGTEIYYYIISFPYAREFLLIHLLTMASPLLILFMGCLKFNKINKKFEPSLTRFLLYSPTYPIILFIDIYAIALGFVDHLLGRKAWGKISRSNIVDPNNVPLSIRESMSTASFAKKKFYKILIIPILAVVVILINDLLVFHNCGRPKHLLGESIIFDLASPIEHNLTFTKKVKDQNDFTLNIESNIKQKDEREITIEHLIENKTISNTTNYSKIFSIYSNVDLPMGWAQKKITTRIKARGLFCEHHDKITTTVKETNHHQLLINNEPFLIKGVIPSFSSSKINLDIKQGLQQIKSVGANTIRIYHAPTDEIKESAKKHNLLIIDQPDESTWENANLRIAYERKSLLKRYQQLQKKNEGHPYILFDNLGNELELSDRNQKLIANYVTDIINKVKVDKYYRFPLSYSTYQTYINYPVDILGINMLDSGDTYWNKAIDLLQTYNRPYYASEFGGFVAFFESTPTDLRIVRMKKYWEILQNKQSLGAVFFQSHDNWAQPVPIGYNDPFSADQPDDLRGLWDHNNKAKLETLFLSEIYSDLKVEVQEEQNYLSLKITNKRNYALSNIVFNFLPTMSFEIDSIGPQQSKTIKIEPMQELLPEYTITFKYYTHKGLMGISNANLKMPIQLRDKVNVLNFDFINITNNRDLIEGEILYSQELDFTIPSSWKKFKIDGKVYQNTKKRYNIKISNNPYHPVKNIQYSRDKVAWQPLADQKLSGGKYFIKFTLPVTNNSKRYLVLEGLGTEQVSIFHKKFKDGYLSKQVFNYRENIIDLSKYDYKLYDDEMSLEIDRNQILYIFKEDNINNKDIDIDFKKPSLFSPYYLRIERVL